MAGLSAVELTADCEACGLEGGVVEIYDSLVAACRFGLPATSRCKLCAASSMGAFDRAPTKALREIPANRCPACLHELSPSAIDERSCASCGARAAVQATNAASSFDNLKTLEAALDAWAESEKFPSRQALVNATFAEPDIEKLFDALQKKLPLEALADPFANMGVRTTGSKKSDKKTSSPKPAVDPNVQPPPVMAKPAEQRASSPTPIVLAEQSAAPPAPHVALPPMDVAAPPPRAMAEGLAGPPSAPPRAIVFPIVSVIAADGEIHPEERSLIDRFLRSEGLPPLAESEFCVHHPSEVAHWIPKERREDVVKLMCETAAVDGMPDESERRVIRAYAAAWGVDDEKLEFWMWGYESMNTSLTRQLWLKIRRFVLSARWSDEQSELRAGTTTPER